jgi:hypothetical protein
VRWPLPTVMMKPAEANGLVELFANTAYDLVLWNPDFIASANGGNKGTGGAHGPILTYAGSAVG